MGKIMPLDLLSSIKGASSSEAVQELFRIISTAVPDEEGKNSEVSGINRVATLDDLRKDIVVMCPENQRARIKENFPREKNGYLVVPKVIED